MKMKIHPVCDVLPKMSDEDFAGLEADIKSNGVREPGKTYKGFLVDGKHRYLVCEKLGLDFPTVELSLPDGASLVEHCVAINLRRRHLTQSQKAAVATAMLPLLEKEAAARKQSGKPTLPPNGGILKTGGVGTAAKAAADAVGVSARTVERVKRVAKADSQAVEKIKAGTISVREAEKQVADKSKPASAMDTDHPRDDWFASTIARLHAIKRDIVAHAEEPFGRMVNVQSAQTDIANLVRMLRGAEPAGPCPYCRKDASGIVSGCKACKGVRWLSRAQMDAVPKEMLS